MVFVLDTTKNPNMVTGRLWVPVSIKKLYQLAVSGGRLAIWIGLFLQKGPRTYPKAVDP